ncbi:cytochrome P450 [Xylariaceae sp. FL1651]|nr:cytochrome P450 [Xylariaceae sp. FL1651]
MATLIDLLPELGGWESYVLLGGVGIALFVVIYQAVFAIRYPSNLPLVSEPAGKKSFSWKTRWRFVKDCENLYMEAYENYSKKGKTVLIPGLGARDEIILPQSAMKWVLSQPESALSHVESTLELNQAIYSLGHGKYSADGWQGDLVKTKLNASLENICSALDDELGTAFMANFGTDTENWKEIDLLATIRMVVGQAASRFTVGLPMCRDPVYLKESFHVVDRLVVTAGVTGGSPRLLRPLVGRLSSIGIDGIIGKIKKTFEKTYKERLEMIENPHYNGPEPEDHLQMMLRFAQKERPHELHDFDVITKRVIVANFASMHQTSIQVTNFLLNILDSDKEFNTIAVLRDEVTRIMGNDPKWTKQKVQSMVRADSAARETMRLHSFGNRSVLRKVMKDGLTTEDGIALPKGSMVSFLAFPLQVEKDQFEDPRKYDPFRYSRVREAAADPDTGRPGASHLSFVSTSPDHLPFSHGRHACPGRFLIDFELKMIVAYVLMNYDIEFPAEYDGKRPQNFWLAEANMPPAGVKLRLKRRPGTV